ncbi:MAG: aminotransferase, partial [Dactylosporangium sp.]|nr:aminotransferase class IV [Dactylosporangium sp.]NNJ63158.1 aminotransferase [Dactylosporangium sp.]
RVDAPWLLAGAKTLSYAINMATQRWGLSEGADDVLWVSSDGYALEAPTSTLVWLHRNVLCTVPPEATGVLPGTTAAWLFDRAGTEGWTTEQRMVRPDDLMKVDGAWLTSSVRGAVEIRSLNGVAREGSSATGRIVRLLGFPTGDEPPIGSR